jgi:hypothetical protein
VTGKRHLEADKAFDRPCGSNAPEIMAEHRALAEAAQERPVSRVVVAFIVAIWIASTVAFGWIAYRMGPREIQISP